MTQEEAHLATLAPVSIYSLQSTLLSITQKSDINFSTYFFLPIPSTNT